MAKPHVCMDGFFNYLVHPIKIINISNEIYSKENIFKLCHTDVGMWPLVTLEHRGVNS
jgi:hypothetical protein